MTSLLHPTKKLRILDFDTESRPLSFWYGDKTTAEITAIASCWTDDIGSLQVHLLGEVSQEEMLDAFVERYNEADMVTGHFIRRFDLPLISGQLLELGRRPLKSKLTCDTRMDMFKKHDIPATQEYLGEVLGLPVDKVQMSQHKWRNANRLSGKGLEGTRKRVEGDVLQHMFLREKMLELGLLKGPRVWSP